MRFGRRRREDDQRRAPRAEAFRSTDLVRELRAELAPWLKAEGFKRLGGQAWVRDEGDDHLIVAVQSRQSGWDPRAGTWFVVELERSARPRRGTGHTRRRLGSLLDEPRRRDVLDLNNRVAASLPPPDRGFVGSLPPDVRDHYLRAFRPTTDTTGSADLWFAYYDESDAAVWAVFIAAVLPTAVDRFLELPPGWFDEPADPDPLVDKGF